MELVLKESSSFFKILMSKATGNVTPINDPIWRIT
jgi:hypothetical protein